MYNLSPAKYFDFPLLLPVISERILHYLLLSHVPVYVSCGRGHSWESDLYQLRKKNCWQLWETLPFCSSWSSWKSVCETEWESCVCLLKLMACAVGKWMICPFSARFSHNENLSVQIMPNSHALIVHRSACDTREESMHRFQPLPTRLPHLAVFAPLENGFVSSVTHKLLYCIGYIMQYNVVL